MLDHLIYNTPAPELEAEVDEMRQIQAAYAAALQTFHTQYYQRSCESPYLKAPLQQINPARLRHTKERFTLHEGLSGTKAILAVHYFRMGDALTAGKLIDEILSLSQLALADSSDEILYGRAGYVLALLFIKERFPDAVHDKIDATLKMVFRKMIESGRNLGGKNCPLFYQWHEKSYLGSAHGLTGILQVLLKCGPPFWAEYRSDISTSIDRVLHLVEQYSGRMPSSLESKNLKYSQWCHGPPGAVFLICEALKHLPQNKNRYLEVARAAADQVWKTGILQKGPGLCHGVSGNAFVFLSMYRATGAPEYLNRAYQFLKAYESPAVQAKMRTPDSYALNQLLLHSSSPRFFRPFSLYEGLGGLVVLAANLLFPNRGGFPAFEAL